MNPAALALALLLGHEARITDEQWSEVRAMNKIIYKTSPYTGDADLPYSPQVTHRCPACETAAQELADMHALCDKQSALLSAVAVALRGPELPLTKWSHADLPERAEAILTDHICEQCEELIPLEHPCRCSVCWNKTVGELADLRARFTAAIDELRGMSEVMKAEQVCLNTAAAIDERVAELTGPEFQPDDLRARLEALCIEMETDDRAGKLAHWIISLRKIAERGGAGENGMDILDRAIDRIEEHSWTQDGPMSDEDDAAIDLLKECMEAVERELLTEEEAK